MQPDIGLGSDYTHIMCDAPPCIESIFPDKNWKVEWILEKREGDWTGEQIEAGLAPEPYEVLRIPENGLLNTGINVLLNILSGWSAPNFVPYSSGAAFIKVGNGNTAFSAAQTDLQGGSTAEAAMDTTYPQVSAQTITWRSTYGSGVANFTWEEVGVKNGSGAVSSTVVLLNRKVQSFGTKVSGATWTMTLQITVA